MTKIALYKALIEAGASEGSAEEAAESVPFGSQWMAKPHLDQLEKNFGACLDEKIGELKAHFEAHLDEKIGELKAHFDEKIG